jgi:hypothetical protein
MNLEEVKLLRIKPLPCRTCGRQKANSKTPINSKGYCWAVPGMGRDNISIWDCKVAANMVLDDEVQ